MSVFSYRPAVRLAFFVPISLRVSRRAVAAPDRRRTSGRACRYRGDDIVFVFVHRLKMFRAEIRDRAQQCAEEQATRSFFIGVFLKLDRG
jgi:hypothetical protein